MPKKEPQRMCVACREMQDKKGLLRLICTPDDLLEIDLTGKKAGRGAYICAAEGCLQKVQKNRAFERALGGKPADDFWTQVAEAIAARDTE